MDGHRDTGKDKLTPERRSALMARVRGKDTTPEMVVRRRLHAMGYRFRLHAAELPGKPDIVFRPRRKVVFVHGCFWHRHPGCSKATTPTARRAYWEAKFAANVARDERTLTMLREAGWEALVVWQCETRDTEALDTRLRAFLG